MNRNNVFNKRDGLLSEIQLAINTKNNGSFKLLVDKLDVFLHQNNEFFKDSVIKEYFQIINTYCENKNYEFGVEYISDNIMNKYKKFVPT